MNPIRQPRAQAAETRSPSFDRYSGSTRPRILTAMFEALRTTTFLGLLAAGIPALLSAQAAKPAAPSGQETGSPHPLQLDEKQRPITVGGFVKTGPIVFIDDSEKAGLTHWTHKMGTPAKDYIIETKGSGVGLIDYDNDGWLDIYVVKDLRSTR